MIKFYSHDSQRASVTGRAAQRKSGDDGSRLFGNGARAVRSRASWTLLRRLVWCELALMRSWRRAAAELASIKPTYVLTDSLIAVALIITEKVASLLRCSLGLSSPTPPAFPAATTANRGSSDGGVKRAAPRSVGVGGSQDRETRPLRRSLIPPTHLICFAQYPEPQREVMLSDEVT